MEMKKSNIISENCIDCNYNVEIVVSENWQKRNIARYRKNKNCCMCKTFFVNYGKRGK